MNKQCNVTEIRCMNQEEVSKLNAFLKSYGLLLGGGSYIEYEDKQSEAILEIVKGCRATYSRNLGEAIKKYCGYKKLILDGVVV